ncbi:MAG: ADP-polyphosphate phosphotransferase [Burkholderiaceae bacterium]
MTKKSRITIDIDGFRVKPGEAVDLTRWSTDVPPLCKSDKQSAALLEDHVQRLSGLQELLYASNRYAVLLIFQAMDAAGKDGAIKHVMSGVNPQGCQVFSYKHPSDAELEHDFLWRTTRDLPERGRIGIFNRSYYEEVLVVKVHRDILQSEGLADVPRLDADLWRGRYRSIVDAERHLHANGTRIIKCFLHLSRDEQRRRFIARIDDPEKNWKFSDSDIHERKFWDAYMAAYATCLSATSTTDSPWYIIPADDKDNSRLIVSQIVVDTIAALKLSYPATGPVRERELQKYRAELLG